MNDLRLADEMIKAATYMSRNENTDVVVMFADNSRQLYVKGEDKTPVWFAVPAQIVEPGQAPIQMDLTPVAVRLGRWRAEADEFTTTKSMSVEKFLELYRLAVRNAH